MYMLKKNREIIFIIIMSTIFLISRILLMIHSYQYLDGDNAVYGIVAKHIIDTGEFPFYIYGQHYNGGATIISYLFVIPYFYFGVNSMYLIVITVWLAFLLLSYIFVKKFFSKEVAIVTMVLLTISPPTFTYFNIVKGDYMICIFVNLILVYIFYNIFFNEKHKIGGEKWLKKQ